MICIAPKNTKLIPLKKFTNNKKDLLLPYLLFSCLSLKVDTCVKMPQLPQASSRQLPYSQLPENTLFSSLVSREGFFFLRYLPCTFFPPTEDTKGPDSFIWEKKQACLTCFLPAFFLRGRSFNLEGADFPQSLWKLHTVGVGRPAPDQCAVIG